MKSLNIKFPFSTSDLLSYFDRLNTRDLQGLAEKLAHLIAKRNAPSPRDRETALLEIIKDELPATFIKRLQELKAEMEEGVLSKSGMQEMEAYVERIEAFDTKKIEALHELSTLKKISFQQLAEDLAVFSRKNG